MSTIFHKILSGEIPNYTVYEDEDVLAFLDITPKAKGHTIVIPKVFAKTLQDVPADLYAEYMIGIQQTMKRLDTVLHPEGYTVGWNVGEAAGQSVPYVHCHIIPRWEGDEGGSMHSIVDAGDASAVAAIAVLFE